MLELPVIAKAYSPLGILGLIVSTAMAVAAYEARLFPYDSSLLLLGAILGISHALLWQFELVKVESSRVFAVLMLACSPIILYGFAIVLTARFFFTSLEGFPKYMFLSAAFVALSPLLLLVLLFFLGAVSGKRS